MAEQAIFMYFSGLTPLAVPFQRGHNALNPKTWTSALLLFYLSPVFCRTHSACFQANALCIVIMDIFYNVTL
ncbi:hypothetical protein M483_2367 [Yersinia pestis 3770]|nr:hypothetical protein BZ18_1778 [Yersinia pestis Pestoides F]AJK23585.1 hypothetical protein CH43_1844 [Yersinia pestis Pestoides G]AKS76495.1 hypothetical protein M480_2980 [Yersinia pestis 1413]AKS93125.1 hypothetical protein M483_2367 [Yersinia pestis 3770]AKS96876.1 hypothetical protein M482_2255 [Yersinia pestis 3067]KNC60396.1 hypothetical protein M476_3863 [Yersinia pestis 1670]